MRAIRAVLVSRGQARSAEEARRIAERFGVRGVGSGRLEPVAIVENGRGWRITIRRPEKFVWGSTTSETRGRGVEVLWGELAPA